MDKEYSDGITLLVQHLGEDKEIIVGRLHHIDREGADFLGIERDGTISAIRHHFPKILYETDNVKKYLVTIIEMMEV